MRFKLAIAALALSTTSVIAADYGALRGSQMGPTTRYTPSPAASDKTNWEGFYLGAMAGYSHAKNTGSTDVNQMLANAFRLTAIQNEYQVSNWPTLVPGPTRSPVYGLFGGYNMVDEDVVFGLDVQAGSINHKMSASDYIGRVVTPNSGFIETVRITSSVKRSIDGYATMRLRVGQAFGNFLPYIAGGIAVGKGSATANVSYQHTGVEAAPADPLNPRTFDTGLRTLTSGNRNAYALGFSGAIGMDFMFGGNMFGRAEFSHTRFNSDNIRAEISKVNAGVGVKF